MMKLLLSRLCLANQVSGNIVIQLWIYQLLIPAYTCLNNSLSF